MKHNDRFELRISDLLLSEIRKYLAPQETLSELFRQFIIKEIKRRKRGKSC